MSLLKMKQFDTTFYTFCFYMSGAAVMIRILVAVAYCGRICLNTMSICQHNQIARAAQVCGRTMKIYIYIDICIKEESA